MFVNNSLNNNITFQGKKCINEAPPKMATFRDDELYDTEKDQLHSGYYNYDANDLGFYYMDGNYYLDSIDTADDLIKETSYIDKITRADGINIDVFENNDNNDYGLDIVG